MQNNSNKKYIVVHAGKRDDYQVALALAESDLLFALVTEAYFPLDKKWFLSFANFFGLTSSLHKRYKTGLPSNKVIISKRAMFYQILFSFTKNIKFDLKKGYVLGEKAKALSQKNNVPIIAVNTCAYHAFLNNSVEPKILFQFHPQADFVKELFLEEMQLNPKATKTLNQEYEFSLSNLELEVLSREVKLATHFLCASSLTKKSLTFKGISEDKIKVIPYGVDTSKFTFSERKQSENFKVIFIGSLNQRKGITYLLDALAEMINVELTIVTRGIYDETLIQNYNFPIHVVIDVPHEKLQDELHKAHCFVLPSILEGFGQVILEAMATGIPVIATENTAAIDIIENEVDGFVTPIRDIQAIKESLEKLQSDFSFAQTMGKASYEKAKVYSWEKFRNDFVTHIQSLS
ncbi:glycosyltransferase family 4 protein [Flavobacterium sp. F372]|uniref:Glycosyltransferase family 4 protein n=1 Tax=Flavobacterium bernardetii TaxID=2813823 RepID=A0ABR7IU63_9FLAO|nr:glycosyltransferase family 4 protein [Flavobacterium bernardetii]MBC5833301.1 glycosyltransferase family 4 protein [Flavobacterium bernardetii]NHF68533.1 glycosyltransferase family 4 protein [Flavobacterium bernardetii]